MTVLSHIVSTKRGWTRVAFGDVVRLSKIRTKDPESEGYERVVGLEHIDPGNLRIRRWANVSDGTTFSSVFRPGQVLFGKRRAYQRKVAAAEFAGVCSGDIYVLEPAGDALMSKLLPFICQTDAFFEHAVSTSAGSLSPRTNWKSLAAFEFQLPPIQEQVRIVEVLTAVTNVQNHLYASLDALTAVNAALLEFRMRGSGLGAQNLHECVGRFHESWQLIPLGELVEYAQYGLSHEAGSEGRYPMIRMMNLEQGRVVENDLKFIDLEDDEFQRYRLDVGDVLFNRTNSHDLVGRTGVYDLKGDHVFASYLVRVRTITNQLHPDYLCAFLNTSIGRRQIMSFATRGVSQTNVNAANVKRVLVPVPPLEFQTRTVEAARANRRASKRIAHRIAELGRMMSRMISQEIPA